MVPEALVARTFGYDVSQIDDTTSSETLGEWDSLGQITLVIELESAYGVSFSAEEAMNLTSVGAIKDALRVHDVQW